MPPTDRSPAPSSLSSPSLFGLAALCLLAAALRAGLQFGTPLAPGMNGAYYFVQARAVLEHGHLGIPDLPLTFWLHAGLARLVAALTAWPQDEAIVFAVKLADSVLPPLVALPVAWLGARWSRTEARPSLVATLAPAALVCASAAPLSMTGDFQKNTLALIWFAAAAWTAHRFLLAPSLGRAAALAASIALLGVTHVGVLGSAMVFLAVLALVATFTAPTPVRRRVLLGALGGAVALALGAAVTYRHDPARIQRLWRAATEPSSVLNDHRGPGGPHRGPPDLRGHVTRPESPDAPQREDFADADFGPPPDFASDSATDASALPERGVPPDRSFGPRGMPGPPGMPGALPQWLPRALFISIALAGLVLALMRRAKLPAADFSVGLAAALTAAALGAGLFDEQKSQRLMLIAVVPAAITLSFVLAQIRLTWLRRGLGGAVITLSLVSGALYVARGGHAVISTAQRDELRTIAAQITAPDRTLVVAHHGLEWWTAWTLRTHIAQPSAVSREDWSRYDTVYYLTEKMSGRDNASQLSRGPRGFGPPSGFGSGGGGPRGFGPPGMGPDSTAPENAVTVHAGEYFTLARVDAPPANQATDAEVAARRRNRD